MRSTVDNRQKYYTPPPTASPKNPGGGDEILDKIIGVTRSVVEHLRVRIITGQLAPRKNIVESQLSQELGISRPPLREALRILEKEGLVQTIPRKGSFVAPTSLVDFEEVYQVREMVELYAIDMMKERKIRDLSRLISLLERAPDLTMPPDDAPTEEKLSKLASSRAFHGTLVEYAGNETLFQYYQTIYYSIERYQFLYAFNSGVTHDGLEDHWEIVQLISKGQYGKAKKCLKGHIDFFAEKMKSRMAQVGL